MTLLRDSLHVRAALAAIALLCLAGSNAHAQSVLATGTAPGQLTLGAARLTVITPECIRLEYQEQGKFVDEPSYFAVNRDRRFPGARIHVDGREAALDTGVMQLAYKSDGKPFSPENLRVTIRKENGSFQWKPGMLNMGNLRGATVTLDQWEGARPLPDGLLSRDGWCVLDDSKTALLSSNWVKPRPKDAGFDWYLFGYGNDFKGALKSLTAIAGEVPMPRRYLFGVWYSRFWDYTAEDYRQLVKEYAQHDYPLDIMVMDMDWHVTDVKGLARGSSNLVWTGYTWNRKLLPDAEDLLKWFHAQGLAVTLNDHPSGGVRPHEDCYVDFMKALGRDPLLKEELPFDAGNARYMDAFQTWAHFPLEKEGVDFWWLDWQQGGLVGNVPALTNLAWLNQFYFDRAGRDGKRGVSFSRWAGWGDHRHPIHFSGDASTSFKMLAFEVPFTATSGNSGCFFWSHDIGGHNKGRNEESYVRWCQFGAFSAAMRPHSNRDKAMDRRPWAYPPWAEQSMRVSYGLRSRFFPSIYSSAHQSCTESVPMIRPMYLEFPELPEAYRQPQQYFFGDNILVAPVTEPGAGPLRIARQAVWFPPGSTWYNFFTGEPYEGGSEMLVAAAIDEFPLYLRGGVPVAMRQFSQRPATAPLDDLVLRCYPGPEGKTASSTLYEDDGLTTAWKNGACATTSFTYSRKGRMITVKIDPAVGAFEGQSQARAYTIELPSTRPALVFMVDGEVVKGQYLPAEMMNVVKVPSRSIRRGCVVNATVEDAFPEVLKGRAFAKRAGLPVPDEGMVLKDLLMTALTARRKAGPMSVANATALAASLGVGIFEKNENPCGFPDEKTPHPYVTNGLGMQLEPVIDAQTVENRTQGVGNRFRLHIDGRAFALDGTPVAN